MRLKKILFVTVGCISLGLGCIGVVLPILPTVPFLMITLYCFGRSSDRPTNWFTGTKLYKNNLKSFVKKRGMTRKRKLSIIGMVTLLMAFGIWMMRNAPAGQISLSSVWVAHSYID